MSLQPIRFCWEMRETAIWKLTGGDRVRYLNGQVTQDINALPFQQTRWAAVCNAKGRLEGVIHVTVTAESLIIQADAALRESLGARLEKYLIADDAVLEDVTDSLSLTHYVGVQATEISCANGMISSSDRLGLPGFDCYTTRPTVPEPIAGLKHASEEALTSLEIQHLIPRWGFELSANTLPPEAGLEPRCISYKKGCYVGQEIISRLKSVGHVSKCLVQIETLDVSGGRGFENRAKIMIEGKPIGEITRSCAAPKHGHSLSLGYVSYDHAQAGKFVEIGDREGVITVSSRMIE